MSKDTENLNCRRNLLEKEEGDRQSGIELLKIIAIFLIVISHICQDVASDKGYIDDVSFIIALNEPVHDLQLFLLAGMRYYGVLGNNIFFICSAWFLTESNKIKESKIIQLISDVWIISIIFLLCSEIMLKGNVALKLVIKAIFPTTFACNWYITCYILFYLIHTTLNKIISGLNQREHLRCCIVLGGMYIFMQYLWSGFFFSNVPMLWIAIYFCISYLKKYALELTESRKLAWSLLIFGILGNLAVRVAANVLGMNISYLETKVLHWASNSSPFLIAIAFGSFCLFRKLNFSSKTINELSSLSLLIYIIHENEILRSYFRPLILLEVYNRFGYGKIALWILVISVIMMILSVIVGWLYKVTLKNVVNRTATQIYNAVIRVYMLIEDRVVVSRSF